MRAWQGTGATENAGGHLELKAGDVTGLFAMTQLFMRRHTQGHGQFFLSRRDASGVLKGGLASYTDLDGWRFSTAASANDTDTVEHLRITPSGNVGIGTTSPTSKLHVNGDIYASGSVAAAGNVGIGTTSPARQLHVQAAGASTLRIEVRSQLVSPPITGPLTSQ